jgi:hypothetical protein
VAAKLTMNSPDLLDLLCRAVQLQDRPHVKYVLRTTAPAGEEKVQKLLLPPSMTAKITAAITFEKFASGVELWKRLHRNPGERACRCFDLASLTIYQF